MYSRQFVTSFCDELKKLGGIQAGKEALEVAGKLPYRTLAAMAGGAGLLYGGQRLKEDVAMGEEERKRLKQMSRGY
jgi:hypothetical protein